MIYSYRMTQNLRLFIYKSLVYKIKRVIGIYMN